jgi:glycosyltransferase involved in cell wall biosynthesis
VRVLLLAHDCNPEWPSLPVVGYKTARALAEFAEVVVVTHIRNRQNIEKVGLGKAQVRYINDENISGPLLRLEYFLRGGDDLGWTISVAMGYPRNLSFEWQAWKATRSDLGNGRFDVVHRITPMSPATPSPFASWSPVPFIIGPLNGGLKWPPEFRNELARERDWLSHVRDLYRLLPYSGSTFRKSAAVLAAFRHTMNDLPKDAQSKVINFPEVGVDPAIFDNISERPARRHKTIITAGRLVPYKLHEVLVRAFANHPSLPARLVIVGDGPERPAIEGLVKSLGIDDRVELIPWVTQSRLGELMRESDIFAFPSIRELGAGVVVEAMACGLACVVVDYGGPGTLIDSDRGIKIPLGNKEELVRKFGEALVHLVADEQTTVRLGVAARQHAMRFYSWEAKARKMLTVYEWVLGRGPRPFFWNNVDAPETVGDAKVRKSASM